MIVKARTIGMAVCAVLIVAVGGAVLSGRQNHSLQRTRQQTADQLQAARNELESTEARKARTAGRLAELRGSSARETAAADRMSQEIATLEAELKHQTASLEEAVKELAKVEEQLDILVKAQRSDAVGTTFPKVSLTNGRDLRNAKLVRVRPTSLDFVHSEGKTTVRTRDLPKELSERFGMREGEDPEEIEAEERRPAEVAVQPAEVPVQPAEVATPPRNAGRKLPEDPVKQQRVKERDRLRSRLQAVRRELTALEAALEPIEWKSAPNAGELARLRGRLAALRITEADLEARLRELWDPGP
jgi:chromosome segregation ATPase